MDTNTPKATLITITNNNINQINQKIHTNIPLLDATANVHSYIDILHSQYKIIYKARQAENNTSHREKIEKHIQNRYNKFSTNTTQIINSILKRHTQPVIIDNIKLADGILTSPTHIKQHVKEHFRNWTWQISIDQDILQT